MIDFNLNHQKDEFASNQIILKFKAKTHKKTIANHHNQMMATVLEENRSLGFQVITSTKPLDEILKYYRALKEIEYVRPNYKVHIA